MVDSDSTHAPAGNADERKRNNMINYYLVHGDGWQFDVVAETPEQAMQAVRDFPLETTFKKEPTSTTFVRELTPEDTPWYKSGSGHVLISGMNEGT